MIRRWLASASIASCLAAVTLACHGGALLRGEQYGYRDAAHYYYPLHQKIQQEWSAGRWPLWDPSENAGMPLLGNPTAAVLYPGKLIFAVFDYPLAARLYVVAHTLLAFGAMVGLLRAWGTGAVGASLGGLAYAFGAPVLFQYSNVIFLVGAAWAPLGILAADRWARLGDRRAILGLAAVLAIETLGGDLETAYLTGFFALAYAAYLGSIRRAEAAGPRRARWWAWPAIIASALVAWSAGTLAIATWGISSRPPAIAGRWASPLPWIPGVKLATIAGWVAAGSWAVVRSRRSPLGSACSGLAIAGILAAGLAAAQLLPVVEFARQSGRVLDEGSHEVYSFSLQPIRIAEFLWPNVSGTIFGGNHAWLDASGWAGRPAKVWVPSLYVGGLTLMLALATFRLRGGPPRQVWISGVGLIALVAGCGEYASPIWLARHSPRIARAIGEHDPVGVSVIRADGKLRDGDGGAYWALATLLPGFRQFRFPSKLLTFTALGMAALAGRGWDALIAGDPGVRRRMVGWSATLLALTGLALVWASIRGPSDLASLAVGPQESIGPVDPVGALGDIRRGLIQGGCTFAVALVLASGRVRGGLAGAVGLLLMSADLAVANAGLVSTVPQQFFDEKPEVLAILERSERDRPADGPFRVHRMPAWEPLGWSEAASPDREREFVAWERRTLQPKYGLPLGIEYTTTIGAAELRDHREFFRGYRRQVDPELARSLGATPGRGVVFYPRRAFDLWNTRYFILPTYPNKWSDENRGFAAFLDRTEPIHPPPEAFRGEGGPRRRRDWARSADFQVRRNLSAYPRAWVVHGAVDLGDDPTAEGRRIDPAGVGEILFSEDDRWRDPSRTVLDPQVVAWLDPGRRAELGHFLDGRPPSDREGVRVVQHGSVRVELEARLDRPGLVVVSDVIYPGWTLAVDGQARPIERANRMMRAVAVEAGVHRLVFEYRPASFRAGLTVSGVSLAILLGAGPVGRRRGWFRRPATARDEDHQTFTV